MKQLLNPANATFSVAGATPAITFATTIPATISHILHVTNITTGQLIYQPQAGLLFSGTYASPTLTLNCSKAGMAGTDKLEIFWDDGASEALDGTDGSGITPPTAGVGIRGWLSGIYKKVLAMFVGDNSSDGEAAAAAGVLLASETYPKMFNGTTFDRIKGDTTNGLWVNVKAFTGSVAVTTNTANIAVTPTVTQPTSYTTGQCIGGLLTFAGAARVSAGMIQAAALLTRVFQSVQFDLFLFSANPTGSTITDKSTLVIAAADSPKLIGALHMVDWTAGNPGSVCTYANAGVPFVIPTGTSLYGALVARGTTTAFATTSDLVVSLTVSQD